MTPAVPNRPDWRRHAERLDALREARYNVDLDQREDYTAAAGWHLDRYDADLPPEPPGPPLPPDDPRASFEIAWGLVRNYDFPDPKLIVGIYSPDDPLPGRPMLLRARFLGFTFWFGVRIGREINEVRETEAGRVHVRGMDYATLEGHFERGQITFEIRKTESTGAVAFHVDAFSQRDRIRNPFYRLGFAIFGRMLQKRFARTASERMQRFTAEALRARATGAPPPAHETVEEATPPPEVEQKVESAVTPPPPAA